jgi:hypothetical protein
MMQNLIYFEWEMVDMDAQTLLLEKEAELVSLREENRKLQDTVDWMHDMIWDLIRKQRRPIAEKQTF